MQSLQLRGILKWQLTSFYAATVGELLSRNSHLNHKLGVPTKFAQCDINSSLCNLKLLIFILVTQQ